MVLKKHISYLFFAFVFLLACQSDSDPQLRGFEESKIEQLNSSDRYNYDKEIQHAEPNFILQALGAIIRFLAMFNNVIGYIFLAALLILLIYILVKNSDNIFRSSRDIRAEPVKIINEDHIEEVDYDKLLAMALKENDFTLAVRYHFLKTLKYLQKSKLISWHKDKTNYEYLMEVPDHFYDPLNKLISTYEYVWYGHFQASEAVYQKLASRATELQSIKHS